MPCDTIVTQNMEFKLGSTDLSLLKKALTNLGYQVTMTSNGLRFSNGYDVDGQFQDGKLNTTSRQAFNVNELKREYSKETIKFAQSRYGWSMEEDKENPMKGSIKRRY